MLPSRKTKILLQLAGDLTGYLAIENAALDCDGAVTLDNLTMQKMAMLKEIEDLAAEIVEEAPHDDVIKIAGALKKLQGVLSQNTHLHLSTAMKAMKGSAICH